MENNNTNQPQVQSITIQIPTISKIASKRPIIPTSFVIIIICFFFSFCDFKCGNNVRMSITGIDFIRGKNIDKDNPFNMPDPFQYGNSQSAYYQSPIQENGDNGSSAVNRLMCSTLSIFAFLSAIIGFFFFLFKKQKGGIFGIVVSAFGFGSLSLLYLFVNDVFNEKMKDSPLSIVSIDFQFAYWLALLSFAVAGGMSLLRLIGITGVKSNVPQGIPKVYLKNENIVSTTKTTQLNKDIRNPIIAGTTNNVINNKTEQIDISANLENSTQTNPTPTKQVIEEKDKPPRKRITSKQKKYILIVSSLVIVLGVAGYFSFNYLAKNPYRKAVSAIAVGDFQQARYYADNCYTAINNQELELTYDEKKNLDLASDIANLLQKFSDFKQKFPKPAQPIFSQSKVVFEKEYTQIAQRSNLFVEIPFKNILEKTSVDIDIKKLMNSFIKYSDSLRIGLAEYILNDSFLLATKTNKIIRTKEGYSSAEENVKIAINNIIDKDQNANKISSLQAKLKIVLQAINDNIKKQEDEQKKIEQDSLQEGDSEGNNVGDI